jgi:hypothetical protein
MKAEEMYYRKISEFSQVAARGVLGPEEKSTIYSACIIAEAMHEAADKVVKAMGERG